MLRLVARRQLPTLRASLVPVTVSYRAMATSSTSKGEGVVQKIKRGTKFTISSAIILGAVAITSISMYLVFQELLSPSGETSTFNRVVNMIQKDPGSLQLLGYSQEEIDKGGIRLKAYGDVPQSRWTRERPVQATQYTGKDGKEHLLMRFFVESKYKVGVVQVEAIEDSMVDQRFVHIMLDVKGEPRYYLVGQPQVSSYQRPYNLLGNKGGFLGVTWGPKKTEPEESDKSAPK